MRASWVMILMPLVVLTVYAGMNVYVANRLLNWTKLVFPLTNHIFFIVLYVLFALSIILGFFPLPFGIKTIFRFIASYWMGIFIYLFLFFVAADLLVLFGSIIKIIPGNLLKTVHFFKGLTVILLTAGFVFYGIFNANRIITVPYNVQLNRPLSNEFKIVLIADLHLGEVNSEKRLDDIVRGINALKPDIVCITGDIFNDDYNLLRDPDRAIALLKSIESRHGVYAVLGNHDGGGTLNQMIGLLAQSNITLLNDEYKIIDEQFVLVGRLDASPIGGFGGMERKAWTELYNSGINNFTEKNMPIVVMDHNPANIKEYGEEIDLMIVGHTHKGQIFPGNLFTRAMFVADYGHYRKNDSSPHVIVTQGVGTWMMPMRIGTNNEIVGITLRGSE